MRRLAVIPCCLPTVELKPLTSLVMIPSPTGSLAGDQNSRLTLSAAATSPGAAMRPAAAGAVARAAAPVTNERRLNLVDDIDPVLSLSDVNGRGPMSNGAIGIPGHPTPRPPLATP